MKRILLLSVWLMSCATAPKPVLPEAKPDFPVTLAQAVENPLRTQANRARDRYRHPQETLAFFEVQPDMHVLEIWPGTGWYTEILAPYLTTKGSYTAAVIRSSYTASALETFNKWVAAHPEVKVKTVDFNPPDQAELGPEGSMDRVLTFRNFHNWASRKAEGAALNAIFKVLKPGGILGVVDHRANKKQDLKTGYIREDVVIAAARKAGFKLLGQSEVNANALDTKDHPEGVWTLPPSLRLGDKDRDKYLAMGESDRMTLKLIKPIK